MRVFIRRVSDGVEVEYRPDFKASWEDEDYWWWTDGDAGCDCNRHLFFERAHGREPGPHAVPCGEVLYSVRMEDDEASR